MRFGCSRMGSGGLYALDDFRCSSSHVASGFQLAYRRGLIHLLLVVGLVVLVINLLGRRRAV